MDLYSLPDELRQQVEEEIEPGETVRWLGQPEIKGFPWAVLYFTLWGIAWTVFLIVWLAVGGGFGSPPGPTEWVITASYTAVFILIGISMMWWPLSVRRCLRQRARRSAYLITDRRAIIFDRGFAGTELQYFEGVLLWSGEVHYLRDPRGGALRIRSFRPEDLTFIQPVLRANGSGDLILQHPTVDFPLGFYSIPHIQDAENQLRLLRKAVHVPSA